MTMLACARGDDRLPMLYAPIDSALLLDRWRNPDPATRGISEVVCSERDGQFCVRVIGIGPDGPIDWGEVPATLYTDVSLTGGGRAGADPVEDGDPTPHYADISATDAGPAFATTYDHGFMRIHLQGRLQLGLLVMAMFNEFTDDSGRSSYFNREVFAR